MKLSKTEIFVIGMILASFLISGFFYSQTPDPIASHWNLQGQVDGYMPRLWGLFFVPFLMVVFTLLFFMIPSIDPMKKNIAKFRKHYDWFIILLLFFFLFVQTQMILWNIGIKINPSLTFPTLLGVLSFYIGILCEHAKRNWFIGIRTPWTMSSDRVWDKTHKLGSKLFKAAGAISFFGIIFQDYAMLLVVVPLIFVAVYTVIYSYLEFKKEESMKERHGKRKSKRKRTV